MIRLNKDDFDDIWKWTSMLSRELLFQSFHTCFNKTQRNVSRAWELCHIFVHTKDMTNFSINFSNSNFHFNISSNLTCLWLKMLTMLCCEFMCVNIHTFNAHTNATMISLTGKIHFYFEDIHLHEIH